MNGIEHDLQDKASVVRFNLLSTVGKAAAERWDVHSGPTTIVLDGADNVVYRHAGLPDRAAVVRQVTAAQAR